MEKNSFWSPYGSGIGLGLTLLAAFYVMGKGLGASSAFSIASVVATLVATQKIYPEYAGGLKYFLRYFSGGSPLKNWIVFEIPGLFIGAITAALLSRNFKLKMDKLPICPAGCGSSPL